VHGVKGQSDAATTMEILSSRLLVNNWRYLNQNLHKYYSTPWRRTEEVFKVTGLQQELFADDDVTLRRTMKK